MITLIAFLSFISFRMTIGSDIFCPDSRNDDETFTDDNDFGLNIYAQFLGQYAEDCYIRYSRIHQPSASEISPDFINPSYNTLVVSHGWEGSENYGKHSTPDQWSKLVEGVCYKKANSRGQGLEPCEPTDHDSKYWSQNGWNVIMLEWTQFATEENVADAEDKLYLPAYDGTNQSVVELMYDKLESVLNLTGWNGNELRFAGFSLGAQLVTNLASQWKLNSIYADKLRRVALLDPYFSEDPRQYLPTYDQSCWWGWSTCIYHQTPIRYAAKILFHDIRGGGAVIEQYRTSLVWFLDKQESEFYGETVFNYLNLLYYSWYTQQVERHLAALAIYLHCMKFNGTLHNDAPNCRMDTDYMINNYCPDLLDVESKCTKWFEQKGGAGAWTTWDTDDKYSVYKVEN